MIAALPLAGCAYLAPGHVPGSTSRIGHFVRIDRDVPTEGARDSACPLIVLGATGKEFRQGGNPFWLVQATLSNGAPQPVRRAEVTLQGFDTGGNERARGSGEVEGVLLQGEHVTRTWVIPIDETASGQLARGTIHVTHATYYDGSSCDAPVPGLPPVTRATSPSGSDLRSAQARLNELGLDCGVADGIPGPRTTACLRQFQRQQRLPETGELDAGTLDRLRSVLE